MSFQINRKFKLNNKCLKLQLCRMKKLSMFKILSNQQLKISLILIKYINTKITLNNNNKTLKEILYKKESQLLMTNKEKYQRKNYKAFKQK